MQAIPVMQGQSRAIYFCKSALHLLKCYNLPFGNVSMECMLLKIYVKLLIQERCLGLADSVWAKVFLIAHTERQDQPYHLVEWHECFRQQMMGSSFLIVALEVLLLWYSFLSPPLNYSSACQAYVIYPLSYSFNYLITLSRGYYFTDSTERSKNATIIYIGQPGRQHLSHHIGQQYF